MLFDPISLDLGPFFWFGGKPGQQLPDIYGKKTAKHNKGNAEGEKLERANIRILKKPEFLKLETLEEVVFQLFEV
jgi:hypothetical protein